MKHVFPKFIKPTKLKEFLLQLIESLIFLIFKISMHSWSLICSLFAKDSQHYLLQKKNA